MKFVEDCLNRHCWNTQRKLWFFAFLLSPLHYLECQYKKRYKLTYAHARKLFFFDLLLLASVVALFGATVYWHFYDPTITDSVDLSISVNEGRFLSGDQNNFSIEYRNNAQTTLLSPVIILHGPPGFSYVPDSNEFNADDGRPRLALDDLAPGAEGSLLFTGLVYGQPNEPSRLQVLLEYGRDDTEVRETKQASILLTPRGSVLSGQIQTLDAVLANQAFDATYTISGQAPLVSQVSIPLAPQDLIGSGYEVSAGRIEGDTWILTPGNGGKVAGTLTGTYQVTGDRPSLTVTPIVSVNESTIPQVPVSRAITVLDPQLSISAKWSTDKTWVEAGDVVPMTIDVKNNGNVALANPTLTFTIPSSVSRNELRRLNGGSIIQDRYERRIGSELGANESTSIDLKMPVSGAVVNNGFVSIEPTIRVAIEQAGGAAFESSTSLPELPIAAQMSASAHLRYYTLDGDQIGRGPLPPRVGRQTTYWVVANIANKTASVEQARFTVKLSPNVFWQEKQSTSLGASPVYDSRKHEVHWATPKLSGNTTVGVYFAIGYTPDGSTVGTSPQLVQSIELEGYDPQTDQWIKHSYGPLDISMPSDELARVRGTKVKE